MADNSTQQSNNCAYCLKPVVDNFICTDCMTERNVSVERIGVPSEELINQHASPLKPSQVAKPLTAQSEVDEPSRVTDRAGDSAALSNASPDDGGVTAFTNAKDALKKNTFAQVVSKTKSSPGKGKPNDAEWKKVVLHSDFAKISARANLVTYSLFVPVAIVGFGVTSMFGFPLPLAGIIAIGLAVGWVIFRSEQKAWYHYATWVFTSGQSIECDLDVVSSGELDQPYIVLKDENRLSHAYDTKVFKVVIGDTKKLFSEHNAPGSKSSFRALAHFERKPQEQAIIFELADMRLWCKPHLNRGF